MNPIRLFGLLTVLFFIASLGLSENIVTTNGVTYNSAKITGGDVLGIKIIHKAGVAYIPFSEMTDTDKTKYGYDPKKVEALNDKKRKQKEAAELAAKEAEEKKLQEIAKQKREEEEKLAAEEKERQEETARKEQIERDRFKLSGLSVAAFHALKPTDVKVFLTKAKLDDYFNYEFREAESICWSIRLETIDGETIGNGYILKKKERATSLFMLLADGKWHPIIARLKYTDIAESSGCFGLLDYQETTIKEKEEN